LKMLAQAARADKQNGVKTKVITIGNKGVQFVRRLSEVELLAHYPAFGDEPTENDIKPILTSVIEQYRDEHVDEVHLLYTDFRSTISQVATDLPLLPASIDSEADEAAAT